ncbi:MAG: Holliday junction DNA helicase RuvB C-terminal domain-containing protein [Polyangiaceae bacterium]
MPRRPAALHDFVGQPRVVAHLRELVAGARARSEAVVSLLLVGRSGMGKSALAAAIAREYAGPPGSDAPSSFKRIMGGTGITTALVEVLATLQHGDVLFIDETHSLDREGQELLYLALDEHKTFARTPKGAPDRTQLVSVAEFTLVAATTEPGKLGRALRSRLHQVHLDPYSGRELKVIAEKVALHLGLTLTPQAARHLAERSQRTPRSVLKLVELMAITGGGAGTITQETVRSFMRKQGIDEQGLNPFQRSLLEALAVAQRTMSLDVLSAKLGVDAAYIRTEVEPLLSDLHLIELGPRGRVITAAGLAVVNDMVPPADDVASDAAEAEVP